MAQFPRPFPIPDSPAFFGETGKNDGRPLVEFPKEESDRKVALFEKDEWLRHQMSKTPTLFGLCNSGVQPYHLEPGCSVLKGEG